MTNNKNNSSSELNDPQGIDRSLLEYLKPKSEDRYSKLEAYCDLLTRATSVSYSTSVAVGNLKLLPGQFIATISELARKWQWQRATVRQFLTGLANLGHLTMEQFSKSYVFSVSQEQRLSLFVETPSDILDFNALQFVRFIKGRNTAEPVSRYTKAEVILLDCIFEYYVSDPGTFYYDDPPRPDLSPVEDRTDDKPGGTSSIENGTD